jgi:hypothetical protein
MWGLFYNKLQIVLVVHTLDIVIILIHIDRRIIRTLIFEVYILNLLFFVCKFIVPINHSSYNKQLVIF